MDFAAVVGITVAGGGGGGGGGPSSTSSSWRECRWEMSRRGAGARASFWPRKAKGGVEAIVEDLSHTFSRRTMVDTWRKLATWKVCAVLAKEQPNAKWTCRRKFEPGRGDAVGSSPLNAFTASQTNLFYPQNPGPSSSNTGRPPDQTIDLTCY